MKITQLNLVNFRAAQGLTLTMDAPRVLITGVNGAGKTSIKEAIRWTLRGLSEVTDQRGSGQDLLAPHGTTEVSAKVTIGGVGEVSRLFSQGGGTAFSVEGFTGTSGTQQQALYGKLQTTPEYLDCVLDTETFGRLHHADAKGLVLSLLNVKVKVPTVVPLPGSTGPSGLTDSAVATFTEHTLDELDVQYKAAFEQRKEAKRRLQLAPPVPSVAMPPDLVERMASIHSPTIEDFRLQVVSRLGELRKEHGDLRQAVGETIGKRTALTAERDRLHLVRQQKPAATEADELRLQELQQSQAEDVRRPEPLPPGQQVVRLLKTKAEALAAHDPNGGCVIDGEVTCKTARKLFAQRGEAVRQEYEALSLQKQASFPTEVPNLQQQIQVVQDRLKAAYQQKAAIEQAGGRLAEVEEDLSSLPETIEQEAILADIATKITRGETLLAQVDAHRTAVERAEVLGGERKALEAKVAELETRVEQLGPKGLRVEALANALGPFEAAINSYLAPWGWSITFTVEPWTVHVNDREWRTYSKSERYRIGLAVQFALAQMSGLSFALVDEADMLDVEKRRALARMIAAAPLEQIIMFATREPGEALPAPHEDWIFVRLAESRVVEVVAPERAVA